MRKAGNVLTVNVSLEEDIRLSRIANGDVGEEEDDSENDNEAEMPKHDDHHEVAVPGQVGGCKVIRGEEQRVSF